MSFHSVPLDLPLNVKILDISYNSISQVKDTDFKNLTNLNNLNMSNNLIFHVEKGAFKDMITLVELNLSKNKLTTVSKGMLEGLGNLTVLRLDRNYVETLDSSAFQFLSNVKKLYLGGNNFSVFQSKDFSNTSLSLKALDLSRNPLRKFCMTADILPQLETLDLSNTGQRESLEWTVLDGSFLSSVKTLNLSGIHISEEGMATILQSFQYSLENLWLNDLKWMMIETVLKFGCFPKLRVLRILNNNLISITDTMFQPCSLVNEVDLSGNGLCNLSELTFRDMKQLSILRLPLNKLTRVNNATRYLPNLEVLDLSRNIINKLTCFDFANLTKLRRLHLSDNHISSITNCLFKDLKSLKVLWLPSNKLLTIKDAFITGLQNLEILELEFNKISSVEKGTFKNLKSLKYLSLTDNQISVIEENAFAGLENLTQLLLASNKISQNTLKRATVFSGMPNLEELFLYDNYLSYKSYEKLKYPPFILLKSLNSLAINSQHHNGIRNLPMNLLEGLTSLLKLYAGNLNIHFLHPNTFTYTPHLTFLDLSKNAFTVLTAEVFLPIPELTRFILSKTEVQSLDFIIPANLTKLKVLRTNGNELAVINETLIHSLPMLKYLDLQNNTFTCDCNNAWFIDWAEKNFDTQVIYTNKFTCSYPSNLRGTKLVDISTDSCMVDLGFMCFLYTTILVLLTLLISSIYHFLHRQVVYAYYRFLAFLYDYKQRDIFMPQGFTYDAFISYNSQDELWVLNQLLPKLEQEQGWKLCLHHRDFQPGRFIMDNIVESIYASRKTICVITRKYLESEWCSREIQVASFRLFDEQKDVLVLIFLEDIPACQLCPYHRMRQLVKKRTYLTWPKPGEDTRVFWQKLRLALKTQEGPEEDCPILSGLHESEEKRHALQAELNWRLEVRRMELEVEKEIKIQQLELEAMKIAAAPVAQSTPAASPTTDSTPVGPQTGFDVSRNISLVPPFRETEVDSYFSAFERIAASLQWPREVWPLLLQCKFVGKAQEVCSVLSLAKSRQYVTVKAGVLRT
ncbi:toll-like receptor 13 [Megalops cyprinoides]|uniref:toll-like receptor 13 n=1 Tax=Megalops cyprinoides TaxID=118141 RepID=UPI0018652C10|nr:toll-like receptor 13 [Megalops cyprinoides]